MPRKLMRHATFHDQVAYVPCPVSVEEQEQRRRDRKLVPPDMFARKYSDWAFRPIKLIYRGQEYEIQANRCINPFCTSFGQDQHELPRTAETGPAPSLYAMKGGSQFECKGRRTDGLEGPHRTGALSNWSLAEEIARLATNDAVVEREPNPPYQFHRDGCSQSDKTPFECPEAFYKRGKSSSASQRWQCRECGKMTNVLPSQAECFTYRQSVTHILPRFAADLVSRTPVRKVCEKLRIGYSTYYSRLLLLEQRCLEFLERHERQALQGRHFRDLWLNTDSLVYHLNPVRMPGRGKGSSLKYQKGLDQPFKTHVFTTADMTSWYVFRADVGFDWNARLSNLLHDTLAFSEDRLYEYARKNARFREFQVYPQSPGKDYGFGSNAHSEYQRMLHNLAIRAKYTDGLHVEEVYVAFAHLWLVKHLLSADEWRLVTDEDQSLISALYRVFSAEIRRGDAHHFICQPETDIKADQAYKQYVRSRRDLKAWGLDGNYDPRTRLSTLARGKLEEALHLGGLYEYRTDEYGRTVYVGRKIEHPLPTPDEGRRWVACGTDLRSFEIPEVADMLLRVNLRALNTFFETLRRSVLIFERPLVTARGQGRAYMYANMAPRYAQAALTIFRCWYNFCHPFGEKGNKKTPAQRLGIAERVYDWDDIIYLH